MRVGAILAALKLYRASSPRGYNRRSSVSLETTMENGIRSTAMLSLHGRWSVVLVPEAERLVRADWVLQGMQLLCHGCVGKDWNGGAAAEEMAARANERQFVRDNSYSGGVLSLQAQHRPWVKASPGSLSPQRTNSAERDTDGLSKSLFSKANCNPI